MASLTETAYYTRRTINWTILGIILYFILRLLWGVFLAVILILFPPKALPPNHRLGKLPAIKFPPPAGGAPMLTFQLETIEGTVPKASASANVYLMPKSQSNLLALTRTQDFAKRLSFDPTPIPEKDNKNIYNFRDVESTIRKLRYDIVSNNFIVRYDFGQDTGLFSDKNLPTAEEAVGEAKSVLQTYQVYPQDIAGGKTQTIYLRLNGAKLITTNSITQADALKVNFFRQSLSDAPIVTPDPDDGPISLIFSGSTNPKKHILQFAYTYWPIDMEQTGTYGLKSTAAAWQELQSGGGFIARYPKAGTIATVRNVYLAYYDSYEPQTYLQPVFVFEGDNDFMAYVPAVAPPWTE